MPLFGSPGKRRRDKGPAALGGGLAEQQWQVAPTSTKMVLSALASYPARTAFQMGSQSLTYRATLDLIGRMQGVMARSGVGRGDVVAGLSSNRFEAWCAGVAAHALGAITTPLHPLGSLQDHIDQIEDTEASFLVVDVDHYRERAGQLAEVASLNTMLTLGGFVRLTVAGRKAPYPTLPIKQRPSQPPTPGERRLGGGGASVGGSDGAGG